MTLLAPLRPRRQAQTSTRARADRDPSPLAVNGIGGHLLFTPTEVWACYRLPDRAWWFLTGAQREAEHEALAAAWARLAGRSFRLRVTTDPYDHRRWARGLDFRAERTRIAGMPDQPGSVGWQEYLAACEQYPDPTLPAAQAALAGLPPLSWDGVLGVQQQRIRAHGLAERWVVLIVRVGRRPRDSDVWRLRTGAPVVEEHPGHRRLAGEVQRVDELVARGALGGQPLRPADVAWFLHRCTAPGLPPPGNARVVPGDGWWGPQDMVEFFDGVDWWVSGPRPRSVLVEDRRGRQTRERHVVALTMGAMGAVNLHGDTAAWIPRSEGFGFPVEWSLSMTGLHGQAFVELAEREHARVSNSERHLRQHRVVPPASTMRAIAHGYDLADRATTGGDVDAVEFVGPVRMLVSGSTEAEALDRSQVVIDEYADKCRMRVDRPRDQYNVVREFVPCEPVSNTGWRRFMPAPYLASALPQAATVLGDGRGPLLGYTSGVTRRPVMHDPHYAVEVLDRGAVTLIWGSTGSGKSMLLALLAYLSARRGIPTWLLDQSGKLAPMCGLPDFAGRAHHLDLSGATPGATNPFGLIVDPPRSLFASDGEGERRWRQEVRLARAERHQLVVDVLRGFLPVSLQSRDWVESALGGAVRHVHRVGVRAGSPETVNPWRIHRLLERGDVSHRELAGHLEDVAEMPGGMLAFPEDRLGAAPVVDVGAKTLVVVSMKGSTPPKPGSDPERWTTGERLALPLLHMAAHLTARAVWSKPDRAAPVMVGMDETHGLVHVPAGLALQQNLGRNSRYQNAHVALASQNPADHLAAGLENNTTYLMAGRVNTEADARDACRLMALPADAAMVATHLGLSAARPGEFVYQRTGPPPSGQQPGRMRADLRQFPHMMAAVATSSGDASAWDVEGGTGQ